jgi:hypothetical protein
MFVARKGKIFFVNTTKAYRKSGYSSTDSHLHHLMEVSASCTPGSNLFPSRKKLVVLADNFTIVRSFAKSLYVLSYPESHVKIFICVITVELGYYRLRVGFRCPTGERNCFRLKRPNRLGTQAVSYLIRTSVSFLMCKSTGG